MAIAVYNLPRISLGLWHNFGFVDDFDTSREMIKYAFSEGVFISIWQIIMDHLQVQLKLTLGKY